MSKKRRFASKKPSVPCDPVPIGELTSYPGPQHAGLRVLFKPREEEILTDLLTKATNSSE